MSNFELNFQRLKAEREAINIKLREAKKDAIARVQELIDEFGIARNEVVFTVDGEVAKKTRAPAAIKYRTPTGIEWTGKGQIKKELKAYLEENGLTLEDVKVK